MDGEIDYTQLVERALMEVVRESLRCAAKDGLSGQQHFYITFKTRHPGITLPGHLLERYQDEMTIVLQHQFWNLEITPEQFSLELSFNHNRELLIIPFAAVTAFADPSVQFGLQFTLGHSTPLEEGETTDLAATEEDAPEEEQKIGEVIALDAFRKK